MADEPIKSLHVHVWTVEEIQALSQDSDGAGALG